MIKYILSVTLFLFTCWHFEAQLFISENAKLYCTESAKLYTNYNLQNYGEIFLENGKLIIDAGFDNTNGMISFSNATFIIGSGNANSSSSDQLKFNTNDEVNFLEFNKSAGTTTANQGELKVLKSFLADGAGYLQAEKHITLSSSPIQNTAYVLASTATGEINVQVERFITPKRVFRLYSPAVTSTSSVYENLQENGNSASGYGTHITGSGGATNGFDPTSFNNPSMFIFDNSIENQAGGASWLAVTNTNLNTMAAGNPYRILIRGDRNIDLSSNQAPANATILRANGKLNIGNYSPSISTFDGNFNIVGNPYQAVVDFKALNISGDINTSYIYTWDPQLGDYGGFATIETLDGSSTLGSNMNEFIQPGQAFFIRNNLIVNTPPSITFTEASKNTTEEQPSTFSIPNFIKLNLQLFASTTEGEQIVDAIGLRFSENFTNEINDADAGKMGNSGENLALVNNNQLLSIEQRNLPTQNEEIQLFINNFQAENYSFKLQLENANEDFEMYIIDHYLETLTPIDADNDFSFSVNPTSAESTLMLRFSLVFNDETLSDTNFDNELYSVYPNPTEDVIYISGIDETVDVQIFDVMGKEVFLKNQVKGSQEINIQQLSSGVYLLQVRGVSKSFSKKIIKK